MGPRVPSLRGRRPGGRAAACPDFALGSFRIGRAGAGSRLWRPARAAGVSEAPR
ncbi:hypothetical protein G3I59_38890 [Amycolatopsis rubida]|uniref:Uncharacterized protein n=1 Tax=Amycolatopsis rubida TaxID=112413 RepID=A0ABX0C557_9PSEU|nr:MULTISPECIES: hypothetical protein [Amycolatopsis]MYW96426.1 hypothetical protein [Amycolatopsis rubida]NEC61413.1 hypothetical protein [Amycolatopsis rubida]OAP28116.1 hypothetical protein A4R44_01726 [Amycolatopsis sp. M39]